MTHYLPLYFPEAERYYTNSRAQWFMQLLHRFPWPAAITRYSPDAFAHEAWTVVGRKVNKNAVSSPTPMPPLVRALGSPWRKTPRPSRCSV